MSKVTGRDEFDQELEARDQDIDSLKQEFRELEDGRGAGEDESVLYIGGTGPVAYPADLDRGIVDKVCRREYWSSNDDDDDSESTGDLDYVF